MKKHRSFKPNVQREEKKSKVGLYWSVIIILIMVGGIGGIVLSNPSSESAYVYEKNSFTTKNNLWVTKISGKETSFYFLPDQVTEVKISPQSISAIKDRSALILLLNTEVNDSLKLQAMDLFRFELVDTLTKIQPQKQIGFAVVKNSTQYPYPVLSCSNASFYAPILSLNYGNETLVTFSNDCIEVIAFDERSMLMILDNLRYRIYGVIND